MKLVSKISVQDYQKICKAVGWEFIEDYEVARSLKNSHFVVGAKSGGGDRWYGKNNKRQSLTRHPN